ncbi:hypothetical protein CLIB1423_01S12464 [[Candida] railenensis]|uniref:Uncharacterized protein n=1 Tax=[Candida] railenensis TaxID=45579 RepID=A0A9P0QLB6_9ASCO|nr:hypothetical protein CLIB1423_01S12464 [[Candida] railenensis]
MLTVIILLISSISTFVLPLFLTFKLINQEGAVAPRFATQSQFLLSYWMSYILMIYFENFIDPKLLLSSLNSNFITSGFFLLVRIWLFYYHGCLVITKFFGERIGALISSSYIKDYERQLGKPSSSSRSSEHGIASKIWLELFEVNTDRMFRSLFDYTIKIIKFLGLFKFPVGRSLIRFHEFLRQNPSFTLLQGALYYICYMDPPEEVARKYRGFKGFVTSMSGHVSPRTNAMQGTRRSSNRTPSPFRQTSKSYKSASNSDSNSPQPIYSQPKIKMVSNNSSRSNSNKMVGEVFAPERFANIMDEDAISLNSSPSPSPPLEDVLVSSFSSEQQKRVGQGLKNHLSSPQRAKSPIRIENPQRAFSDHSGGLSLERGIYEQNFKAVSYESLKNEVFGNELKKSHHFIDPKIAALLTLKNNSSNTDEFIPLGRPRSVSQPQPPYPLDDAGMEPRIHVSKRKSIRIPKAPNS